MALMYGEKYGYRNSQTTVLAPTGTIGFMMDCDTTGIEPDLALVEVQKAGGRRNDQDREQQRCRRRCSSWVTRTARWTRFVSYIDRELGTIRRRAGDQARAPGSVRLQLQAGQGTRSINYMGHIKIDGGRAAVSVRGPNFKDRLKPASRSIFGVERWCLISLYFGPGKKKGLARGPKRVGVYIIII